MEKLICIFLLTFVSLIAGCVIGIPDDRVFNMNTFPQGVWKSEEPRILIYSSPNYQFKLETNFGFFTTEFGKIKVIVRIYNGPANAPAQFAIYDIVDVDWETENELYWRPNWNPIFLGRMYFNEETDILRYVLSPEFVESTGFSEIIFHRLEDYEPIDPNDWFPTGG